MCVCSCRALSFTRALFVCSGDVVIQNGATSGVGQAVIQLARHLGIRTINVVRKRAEQKDTDALTQQLQRMGADMVVTEDVLSTPEMRKLLDANKLSKPVLALNCVGGQSSTDLLRLLAYVLHSDCVCGLSFEHVYGRAETERRW